MKKSLAHLPKATRSELKRLTAKIREHSNPEMINPVWLLCSRRLQKTKRPCH
jgi:hypothetical protein